MKINTETIGAILILIGVSIVLASATYMFFKLHWICGVIIIGGLLAVLGSIIIGIGRETEDNGEEEEQE